MLGTRISCILFNIYWHRANKILRSMWDKERIGKQVKFHHHHHQEGDQIFVKSTSLLFYSHELVQTWPLSSYSGAAVSHVNSWNTNFLLFFWSNIKTYKTNFIMCQSHAYSTNSHIKKNQNEINLIELSWVNEGHIKLLLCISL